jgi:hypothetical protein
LGLEVQSLRLSSLVFEAAQRLEVSPLYRRLKTNDNQAFTTALLGEDIYESKLKF